MKVLKTTRIAFMLVAVFSTNTLAQNITGNLDGFLVDENYEPIIGANITVKSPSLLGSRNSITNSEGYFRILALPPGTYSVRISHVAFHERVLENEIISLGKTTTLGERQLIPRTFELSTIEVTAQKHLIDPNSTITGGNFTNREIELLPVERNFRTVATLLPQANTSYFGDEVNVAGSTGMENIYFIDGVNVTDPYRAGTSTNLPYNFIKEIQINTGGYEPEYRSALGGVMNVITHSGSNEFYGQAFGFFTNQTFSKDRRLPPGQAQIGNFSSSDIGISLGGPILKDRLWFFTAYNPAFEREEIRVPGFGFLTDEKNTHVFAGKLSLKVDHRTDMTLSIFGDPNSHLRIGPSNDGLPRPSSIENIDPFLGQWDEGGINGSLNLTHILGSNAFIEADIALLSRLAKRSSNTPSGLSEPLFIDISNATWSGGYGVFNHSNSYRANLDINISVLLNKHDLKAGISFESNRLNSQNFSADLIFKISDELYQRITNNLGGDVRTRTPSVFIQDSWQLSNRLQINFGARWDGSYILGSDNKLAQTITDQFQPRLGLIYQPGTIGTQKIFGFYGRFYEHLPLFFSERYAETFEVISFFDHDPRVDPTGGNETPSSGHQGIPAPVRNLKGQYIDEFTLGFEQQFSNRIKISARGIYKSLGQAVDDGFTPEDGFIIGNPGSGKLGFLPQHERKYLALELTIQNFNTDQFRFLTSYTLSRSEGNYAGLFNSENGLGPIPHYYRTLDIVEQIPNSYGLLPNDRTHSFKFSASYATPYSLSIGTSFFWQTGTPISEFGGTSIGRPWQSFISPRGSFGRTPSIIDLNIRLAYDLKLRGLGQTRSRILLDFMHLGNPRSVVNVDQDHFSAKDEEGNQIGENPNFGAGIAFQPPMSVRLGLEFNF